MGLVINRPKIWIKPITWRKINPNKKIPASYDSTSNDVIKSIFYGKPQEKESNYCLLSLAKDCKFPTECQDLVLQNDNSTGYPLAHKLFLMQSMIAVSKNK